MQGCAWLYFTYGRLLNSSVLLVDAPGWHINTCMYFESVNAGRIPAEQWGRTLILPTRVQTHRWGHWRWFQRGEIPRSISVVCTVTGVCFLNESLWHVVGELASEPSIQCRKQSDYWTRGNFKVLFHARFKLNFGDWLHPRKRFCWSALAGLLRLHNSVLDHRFSTSPPHLGLIKRSKIVLIRIKDFETIVVIRWGHRTFGYPSGVAGREQSTCDCTRVFMDSCSTAWSCRVTQSVCFSQRQKCRITRNASYS